MADKDVFFGPPGQRKVAKIGCGIAVLLILLLIALAALVPDDDAQAPTELPVATIRDAGLYPPALNLELDFGSARSADVITAAGAEMAKLGRRMVAGSQPVTDSVTAINFTVLGGAGSDTAVGRKLFHASLMTDTMRELARRAAPGVDYLNAAHEAGSWTPANDDLVRDYCISKQPICSKLMPQ